MKINNLSFGVTNKQIGTNRSMTQNALLPTNILKKNSSYKLLKDFLQT